MARDCSSTVAYPDRIDSLRQLLVALLTETKTILCSLFVKGVSLKSKTAVSGGGFADVYQGLYKGKLVTFVQYATQFYFMLQLFDNPKANTLIDSHLNYSRKKLSGFSHNQGSGMERLPYMEGVALKRQGEQQKSVCRKWTVV